jgi:asparagine synthase (glutamine-hydrolysing)
MARIAGVRSERPMRIESASGAARAAMQNVELVWSGVGEPELHEQAGLLVILDGRIYNSRELGEFESDAALVASLYRERGLERTLGALNGDFALAIYDQPEDTLWLARDRFGVKPLYYSEPRGAFAFASQPGPLLRLAPATVEVDRRWVAAFAGLHYRYFDNDLAGSPYVGVAQLPPAHLLRLHDGRIDVRRWWRLEELDDLDLPEDQLANVYRDLLLDAVGLRLAAAGSSAAFSLSGGMDSGSVLASAVHLTGTRRHAFSTVYVDPTYDETEEIRSILDETVEEWHRVEVGTPDVFDLIARMVAVHDEPVATATWLSHYLLCDSVSGAGFDGLFGGLGGDELNAGEYEYFPYHFADLLAAGRDGEFETEVTAWSRHHDHPIFRKDRTVALDAVARLTDPAVPGRCVPDLRRLRRYAHVVHRDYFELAGWEPTIEHPFGSYLKNRTYQDLTRETAPPCLRAEDRHGAAFGLDTFLPFFDHRLAELMYRVSGSMKIRDGVTKRLLRNAMREIVPEETRLRVKKTGWNAPAHLWFSGKGRERVLDLVRSQAFRERGIYDVAEVERIVDEHEQIVASGETRENHMMFIWQLVNLELWLSELPGDRGAKVQEPVCAG